jgi:error-prone DNA polymerase
VVIPTDGLIPRTTPSARLHALQQKTKGEGVAPYRLIQEWAEGLVCLTGGDEGPLAAALARGGLDEGRKVLKSLIQTFGQGSVYVELQRHRIREQEARNQAAITLAREFHLPLLATNGPNMATAFEREVLDLMSAIRHGCTLDEAGLLLQQNSNRRMLGAKEMTTLFRDLPSAVSETGELSSRLQFVMKDMGNQFPLYPIPKTRRWIPISQSARWKGVANR